MPTIKSILKEILNDLQVTNFLVLSLKLTNQNIKLFHWNPLS